MDFTITFITFVAYGLALLWPLLSAMGLLIVALALWVARLEGWKLFDALYWGFITALTVGYGDFRPTRRIARVLAIVIAINGIVLSGILVALSVEAAKRAYQAHLPVAEARPTANAAAAIDHRDATPAGVRRPVAGWAVRFV